MGLKATKGSDDERRCSKDAMTSPSRWREWHKEAVAIARGEDLLTHPEVAHLRTLYEALKRAQQAIQVLTHEREAACQGLIVLMVRLNQGRPYSYQPNQWVSGAVEIRRDGDVPPVTTLTVLQHKQELKPVR